MGKANRDDTPSARSDFARGWQTAIDWLRQRADSHAGRWTTMDAREALKVTVAEMETIHVE